MKNDCDIMFERYVAKLVIEEVKEHADCPIMTITVKQLIDGLCKKSEEGCADSTKLCSCIEQYMQNNQDCCEDIAKTINPTVNTEVDDLSTEDDESEEFEKGEKEGAKEVEKEGKPAFDKEEKEEQE